MSQNLTFNVALGSILPAQFSMNVGFVSRVAASKTAVLSYSASDGVSCKWNGGNSKTLTIQSGSNATLECSRRDQTKKAYVAVVRQDDASQGPLTIPWQAYDREGNPVDSLRALQNKISTMERDVSKLANSKADISAEHLLDKWTPLCVISPTWNSCPAGFTNRGNFYACVNNESASAIGIPSTGMTCGGAYSPRHMTLCCR
jgi:hypothetical protein